jgi:methylmalonyl-CoA mutase
VIIGVNKYRSGADEAIETREIDNGAVRAAQIARLQSVRAGRDQDAVGAALEALSMAAHSGEGNLLELAVAATRLRATVGEISDALELVWGRHRAVTQSVSGVYGAAFADDANWAGLKTRIATFEAGHGRRPRIMVVKLGQDGHDRGAKVVASAFADLGFDVDIGPLFQTPQEAARQAIENDVHAVGVSTLAAGHKTLVPELLAALRAEGAGEVVVFVGGVVPAQDHGFLYQAGVKGIFGPGTPIPQCADEVLAQIAAAFPA